MPNADFYLFAPDRILVLGVEQSRSDNRLTTFFSNRYIHHLILTHLHPPTLLPQILQRIRQVLFPNSTLPPPSPPPPETEEVTAIKRHCAESILSLLPPAVCGKFFASEDRELCVEEVENELDVWGDGYMNKHLAYAAVELILVRVLPELGDKSVEELLRKRIGDV